MVSSNPSSVAPQSTTPEPSLYSTYDVDVLWDDACNGTDTEFSASGYRTTPPPHIAITVADGAIFFNDRDTPDFVHPDYIRTPSGIYKFLTHSDGSVTVTTDDYSGRFDLTDEMLTCTGNKGHFAVLSFAYKETTADALLIETTAPTTYDWSLPEGSDGQGIVSYDPITKAITVFTGWSSGSPGIGPKHYNEYIVIAHDGTVYDQHDGRVITVSTNERLQLAIRVLNEHPNVPKAQEIKVYLENYQGPYWLNNAKEIFGIGAHAMTPAP